MRRLSVGTVAILVVLPLHAFLVSSGARGVDLGSLVGRNVEINGVTVEVLSVRLEGGAIKSMRVFEDGKIKVIGSSAIRELKCPSLNLVLELDPLTKALTRPEDAEEGRRRFKDEQRRSDERQRIRMEKRRVEELRASAAVSQRLEDLNKRMRALGWRDIPEARYRKWTPKERQEAEDYIAGLERNRANRKKQNAEIAEIISGGVVAAALLATAAQPVVGWMKEHTSPGHTERRLTSCSYCGGRAGKKDVLGNLCTRCGGSGLHEEDVWVPDK